MTGMYLNELLLRLLARDPYALLFDAYAAVVRLLAAAWRRAARPGGGCRGARTARVRAAAAARAGPAARAGQRNPDLQPLQPEARYALVAESGLQATTSPRGSLQGRSGWR
jgi:hypothetical protein